jgi:hypothetical protein
MHPTEYLLSAKAFPPAHPLENTHLLPKLCGLFSFLLITFGMVFVCVSAVLSRRLQLSEVRGEKQRKPHCSVSLRSPVDRQHIG